MHIYNRYPHTDKNTAGKAAEIICTSYYLKDSTALKGISDAAAHHKLRDRMMEKIAKPVVTQSEVKHGDIAPAITPDRRGEGRVFPMIWGFTGK